MEKVVLSVLPPERYFDEVIRILKKQIKNFNIVYVTSNKPYKNITNLLKKKKIKTEKIFFIDCISNQIEKGEREYKNCVLLEGPGDITAISIAINKAIDSFPNKKTLILDSLSTLLVYNKENVIGKFTNFIINKLRSKDVSVIIFILKSDMDRKVIKVVESFVDEVKNEFHK